MIKTSNPNPARLSLHRAFGFRSRFGRRFVGLVLAALLLPRLLLAQTELRPSSVGTLLDPQVTPASPDYNLKLGPVDVLLSAGMQMQFNDNINLSQTNPTSDIILTPQFTIGMFWQLGAFNSIRLNTTIGYMRYLNHPDFVSSNSPVTIAPDSEVSYNIFLGAFAINFHDRFEFTQDPVSEPTLSNVTDLGRFLNTIGAGITWNASRALNFKLDYDHTDLIPQSAAFDFEAYTEDQLSLSGQFVVEPWISVGLEGSVASTRYRTDAKSDAVSTSVGPFVDLSLSSFTHLRLSGGSQGIFFQDTGAQSVQTVQTAQLSLLPLALQANPSASTEPARNQNSYYFNIDLTNNLTKRILQTLSFGRETELAITSASDTELYLRYDIGLNLNNFASLHGNLFYTRGTTSGIFAEHFTQDGVELSASFKFNKHFSALLDYRYAHRTSDINLMSYDQNVVSLSLDYRF